MSGVGPRRPPAASRFRKGQSGNPRGRPKAGPSIPASTFDIVIDRTLTLTRDGEPREVTLEEALQQRTYQDAIAGSRSAQRAVLQMIAKRERWLSAHGARSTTRRPVELLFEPTDPDNADEALLLLGIAEPDSRVSVPPGGRRRLLLQPWAVQLALSRGRRPLSAQEIAEIKRCTRDAETLRWPARIEG